MNALQEEIAAAIQPVLDELQMVRKKLDELTRPEDEKPFTTSEAAKILGVCDATLRRRVHEGKIRCMRTGGTKMLFTREEIAKHQSSRRAMSSADGL